MMNILYNKMEGAKLKRSVEFEVTIVDEPGIKEIREQQVQIRRV